MPAFVFASIYFQASVTSLSSDLSRRLELPFAPVLCALTFLGQVA